MDTRGHGGHKGHRGTEGTQGTRRHTRGHRGHRGHGGHKGTRGDTRGHKGTQGIRGTRGTQGDTRGHRGHKGHKGTTFATVRMPVHTTTKSGRNLSTMWRSTFEIGAAQLCFVTEIAPKSPFLCVNGRPFWYGFRSCARGLELSAKV